MLWKAIKDFSVTLAALGFVNLPSSASVDKILEAYARDHLYALKELPSSEEDRSKA
jgi:hypothetical protein